MKTKILVSAILLGLAATTAFGVETMQVTRVGHGFGTTQGGGIFLSETTDIPGFADGSIIQTFCLERNEGLPTMNVPYDVIVNTSAVLGGVGGGSPDPLDPMTAYLYHNFVNGTLAGYTNDNASADGVQYAVWYIEQERNVLPNGKATLFYNEAFQAVNVDHTWSGLDGVRALNMYVAGHAGDPGYRRQDVLVQMPVPAPGAVLLGSIGIAAVGWLRRSKKL